jgi:hypothetical protein
VELDVQFGVTMSCRLVWFTSIFDYGDVVDSENGMRLLVREVYIFLHVALPWTGGEGEERLKIKLESWNR